MDRLARVLAGLLCAREVAAHRVHGRSDQAALRSCHPSYKGHVP